MRSARLGFITVWALLFISLTGIAQTKKPASKKPATQKTTPAKTPAAKTTAKPAPEQKRDEATDATKVKDMIAFLEYVLNTLGSSTTSSRDKDVLVTQSYNKIFRDAKVQVEDDLDDERTVSTNKDVVAYLKDVNFFFTDVKFEFAIDDIKSGVGSNDRTFYKVSLKRNMKGTTKDGKVLNNTIPRFIEVNYDPDAQDLKIVSMYTHELNPKDALINWWKELSFAWKDLLRKKINVTDSVTYDNMKAIVALTSLDLSNNQLIQDIEPLTRLVNLQTLNVSHTAITSVGPVRNMTELKEADFSYTKVMDISPLKYSDKLVKLNISNTGVNDISVVEKMPGLQYVNASNTQVLDIEPLGALESLQTLNLSHTKTADLTPLQGLTGLTDLDLTATDIQLVGPLGLLKSLVNLTIDSTRTSGISAFSTLENLKVLRANRSQVSDLKSLQKLSHLERVYVDHAQVKKENADALTTANPKVLVIFNSEDMRVWWDGLTPEWQQMLSKAAGISATPANEELARMPALDSVNITNNTAIKNLEPLRKFPKLKAVVAAGTGIQDLNALQEHTQIRYLDISSTEVTDLAPLRQFSRLTIFRADKSKIQNLDPLNNVVSLKKVFVDETAIHDITAREFLEKNHSCLLIYKTIHLNRWWRKLPAEWKSALVTVMAKDTTTSRENLHRLAETETLVLKDAPISDLSMLAEFVRLKSLEFSGTAVTDLTPLSEMKTLRSLHATNSPLQKIEALGELRELEVLDLSNTPIDDLKIIGTLDALTKFNCSGTQVKRLDPLDKVQHLDFLDCSNTKVGSLDPVSFLPLKTLKCYNTKVSERGIEKFKKLNSSCNVVYYR